MNLYCRLAGVVRNKEAFRSMGQQQSACCPCHRGDFFNVIELAFFRDQGHFSIADILWKFNCFFDTCEKRINLAFFFLFCSIFYSRKTDKTIIVFYYGTGLHSY